MDASNMLKPALARGELRAIGATTLNEYQKHIEKDAALERRFQPVYVGEPTVEDTIAILRGLKERYEVHHKVTIRDSAIVAAATLSHRYITDRFLPDKAIDLIDEAASRLRIELTSMPQEIDELTRRLTQLQIEEQALQKEKDNPATKARLDAVRSQISELQEKISGLKAQWESEKAVITQINELKKQLEEVREDANARASARATSIAPPSCATDRSRRSSARSRRETAKLAEMQKSGALLREEVTEEDIAEIVSKWTGVPVTKMLESEMQKLVRMEDNLQRRVIGQEEAVRAVANAVRRSRAGLKDPNRPIGSFIFMGPTGVGKTELARALAEFLFDDENAHGAHRHVGVHGAARGRAAHRRASGLRRLRGGRPAHRSGPPPAVRGGAVRRDREGAPGSVQRVPADPRRRASDGLEGPRGRLQEHGHHHDLERRLAVHPRATRRASCPRTRCARAVEAGAAPAASGPSS